MFVVRFDRLKVNHEAMTHGCSRTHSLAEGPGRAYVSSWFISLDRPCIGPRHVIWKCWRSQLRNRDFLVACRRILGSSSAWRFLEVSVVRPLKPWWRILGIEESLAAFVARPKKDMCPFAALENHRSKMNTIQGNHQLKYILRIGTKERTSHQSTTIIKILQTLNQRARRSKDVGIMSTQHSKRLISTTFNPWWKVFRKKCI